MERLTSIRAGVRLGPLEIIEEGRARNFVLESETGRFVGFIVRRGETVRGYVDLCPHMSLPLAQKLDEYVTPDGRFITCSWHGALFEIENGLCVGGPCLGQRLMSWPVIVEDGYIVTASHSE